MSFSIPTIKSYLIQTEKGCSYSTTSNSQTVLLMHGENFNDYTSNNWNITNSNVAINSSPSKFCNNFSFNGTSSYMQLPNNIAFNLSIFTIEMWIYISSSPSTNGYIISPLSGSEFQFYLGTDRKIYVANNGNSAPSPTTALTIGAWHHIVAINDGNQIYTLQNGTTGGSTPISYLASANLTAQSYIGKTATGNYLNAYVDEIRISNSVIYSNSYTVPSTAFN